MNDECKLIFVDIKKVKYSGNMAFGRNRNGVMWL